MGKGATYWGNENGENYETSTQAIQSGESCYPGKQGADKPGVKDSTEVPAVNK